jgi:acetyl-CoA acetyltransferase
MSAAPATRKGTQPVAIVATAQSPSSRRVEQANEIEMLMPVISEVYANAKMTKDDIDFICSGSTDYLIGGPFSFVMALDAVGVWPPKRESHVEMDAAWALYEAWVQLQEDECDVALVYGFGKSSLGDLSRILALQLDPYVMAPLWPDQVSLAALQAQAMIDAGMATEEDFARVASRARHNALDNPNAQVKYDKSMEELMTEGYVSAPLRRHTLPPISDAASALIMVAGERAFDIVERPAWITGIDHRMEAHALGARNLAASPSTERAAKEAGVGQVKVDVAELHAPFAHQEILLRRALELDDSVSINPSGGPLAANPLMAGGLLRFIEAADRIINGTSDAAVAHATSGPVLQQNMVAVLEAGS